MSAPKQEITKEEIKKEFQLERMILFSDAVFAIVITLMAIEIHLPELKEHEHYTTTTFLTALKHILPTVFAYALSFFFIGMMWYKHLKMFSLLKDYDLGLIIRNLVFLFFIGLFPFGSSLVVLKQEILLPTLIYSLIILLCMAAQLVLHSYILNSGKNLIVKVDVAEQRIELKKRIQILITMLVIATLAYFTYLMIPAEADKSYASLWVFVFAIIAQLINKKKGKKTPVAAAKK
ncbi:TMEM175 family protein [Pedobacter sp. KR3-3]|uniref:TMEM175 family protein n=1 Tax=Pedobacter albus TaxID=3113905 RepID=A0ABU7I6S8_9SPHI|nr:TMEM175 family protein [Pedobacter sp. KR3-3]MEE1945167.1 TMEM175 family protein [Pedobacter sp. KR3-3]